MVLTPVRSQSTKMFIAEVGINHNGNKTKASNMLKKLVKTDIDAITLQILKPEFYRENKSYGSQLSKDFYKKAIDFVHKNNKLIGFAIADKKMVSFLNEAGADFWKILSTSILDNALIKSCIKTNKLLFVSTGVSDEAEILKVSKKFKNVKFIHTQLSQQVKDVNLRAITRLKNLTSRDIAFGLHCSNSDALFLSIAFAPSDVFFYVKDNSREKFADDEHAIVINKVGGVVKRLKSIEKALGTGVKEKVGVKIKISPHRYKYEYI